MCIRDRLILLLLVPELIRFRSLSLPQGGDCDSAISPIIDPFLKDDSVALNTYIANSKFVANDNAKYQECISKPTNQFYLVQILSSKFYFTISLPVCGPSSCTRESYLGYVKSRQSTMEESLAKIMGIELKGTFDFRVVAPSTLPSIRDWVFWLAVVLFSILTILPIVSLIAKLVKPNKSDDLQETGGTQLLLSDGHKKAEPSVLDAFDLVKNVQGFLKSDSGRDENLKVFHGFRFFSMFFVIWGHSYVSNAAYPPQNLSEYKDFWVNKFLAVILGAEYVVDVFFFLGGFFFTFIYLRKGADSGLTVPKYIFMIIHRVLRIVPVYLVVILFYWKVSSVIGSGPVRDYAQYRLNDSCSGWWWRDLTFINNYKPLEVDECMGWGWYLGCEMQIFLIMPFLMIYVLKDVKQRKNLLLLVGLASILYSFGAGFYYEWPLKGFLDPTYFRTYYTLPWTRAPTYFIGAYMGIFYGEIRKGETSINKISNSAIAQILLFIVGASIIVSLVAMIAPAITDPYYLPTGLRAFYLSFSRPLFVIAVLMIILPVLCGGAKLIRFIFGNYMMELYAKLAFSMYLIHQILLHLISGSVDKPFDLTHPYCFITALKGFVVTSLAGLPLHLLVEVPLIHLERFILPVHKKGG
eukprot:TRINITY_DN10786_c0_g1_i1.p1 TRINITY_DN10786_c0_g1~~TRINITY_DN10786_c0_g1_i1.p1  ORF type:complete len:670 (+),score=138.77 TRINITY_DN10786_c0_g1_i1:102-2012(+)